MDTKRRSYDIFDIEERVHALELGGGDTPTPAGGSWDYSTDEVDTKQKWIDGKEIYCKVISGTFNFTTSTPVTILADKGDIESIVDARIFASSGAASPQVYIESSSIKGIHFARFDATYAILYYTKATAAKSTKRSNK